MDERRGEASWQGPALVMVATKIGLFTGFVMGGLYAGLVLWWVLATGVGVVTGVVLSYWLRERRGPAHG